MKNWNYFELISTLYKAYFLYKEQGDSSEQAIVRMGLDFWYYPEEENILENLLLIIVSININISLFNKVNIILINKFEKQLLLIDEESLNIQLGLNEIEHLKETIEEIKFKIDK